MSSAFNQVSRLTTTNPLKMHHHRRLSGGHHKHAHGPPLMGVAAGDEQDGMGSYAGSGQRKWRVLISIGLLLPALAALLGIVAWTISIEVANSGTSAGGPGAATSQAAASAIIQARRAERLQRQQQLRRDEAAALVAIMGVRSRSQAQVQAQQQQQQRTNRAELPVSAPLVQASSETLFHQAPQSHPAKASSAFESNERGQTNELMNDDQQSRKEETKPNRRIQSAAGGGGDSGTPSRPTRTSQRQAQSAKQLHQPQQQPAKQQAGQDRSASDSSRSTNVDQLETLTSSSMETQPAPDAKWVDRERPAKNRKRDDSQQMRAAEEEQTRKSADGMEIGDERSSPDFSQSGRYQTDSEAPASASGRDQSEHEQGFEEQVHIEPETLTSGNVAEEAAEEKAEKQPKASSRLGGSKSKFKSAAAAGGKRAPASKSSVEAGRMFPGASAKQIYLEMVHKSRKQAVSKQTKSDSEYKLVGSMEPNSEDEVDETRPPSTTTTTTTTTTSTTTTTTTTPAPITPSTTTTTSTSATSVRDCDQVGGSERKASSESVHDQEGESPRPEPSSDSESEPPDASTRPAGGNQEEVSFEDIASAISKNLSDNSERAEARDGEAPARAMAELLSAALENNARQMSRQSSSIQPEEDSTDSSVLDPALVSATDGAKEAASSDRQLRLAKRRRTTGEHVAEVIDHIVDKRRSARFGERTGGGGGGGGGGLGADSSDSSQPEGPQIVVVAPVGLDGQRARSLTREQPTKVENKTQAAKKSIEPVKKKSQQKPVRTGARLLGSDGPTDGPSNSQSEYSERVEVIEEDDSSALLMPQASSVQAGVKSSPLVGATNEMFVRPEPASDEDDDDEEQQERRSGERNQMASEQADLQKTLNSEQLSSAHVASNPNEPRQRRARHEASSRYMSERYAPMPRQPQPRIHNQQSHHHNQPLQQQQQASARQEKLYSAEQVIMEHVLKSKARASSEQRQQQPQQQQQQQQQRQAQDVASTTAASTSSTSSTTTSGQPAAKVGEEKQREASSQPAKGQNQSQRQQAEPTLMAAASSEERPSELRPAQADHQQPQKQFEYSNMQPVQVPALFIQQSSQTPRAHHFNPQALFDSYQAMESQQQSQVMQLVRPNHEATSEQQVAGAEIQREQQLAGEIAQFQQQQQQQLAQQQPALPVFADQEIQVPAHMAESVIRDLQQSPSTVRGLYNGQAALFHAQPANSQMQQQRQQVPEQQLNQQLRQHHQQMMLMMQQQQRAHQIAQAEESRLRPAFLQASEQPPQAPRQASYLRQALEYSPLGLVSRLARRNPQEYHNQDQMVSRASGKEESKQQQQQTAQEGSLIDTAVKALGPKGLIQPVAQMALKNLINSLSQQAAAQQAQADAMELRKGAASSQQQRSSQALVPQQALEGATMHETTGTNPAAALTEASSGRSMRSLPIGAQASFSPQQPLGGAAAASADQDQEMQESYGQMPTYHMSPPPPHPAPYRGDNYQGEHDKKTKGITFHFGGGPIGGGTQLITSPMGIFKHLMIPLMPNPRVNLNGKVVFGVVLEKSTAFGPPPKKKYKFWG